MVTTAVEQQGYLEEKSESGKRGRGSASRAMMFFFGGVFFACWVGAGIYIVLGNWGKGPGEVMDLWNATGLAGWMTMGLGAFFTTILPYFANQGRRAVVEHKQ